MKQSEVHTVATIGGTARIVIEDAVHYEDWRTGDERRALIAVNGGHEISVPMRHVMVQAVQS